MCHARAKIVALSNLCQRCKKILEWTPDAASGFACAVKLNDKFELDGRDENAYMGVAWCSRFVRHLPTDCLCCRCFGHHDQPFPERPIYGKVRSMTRSGLEGKFDMIEYRERVHRKCLQAVRAEPRVECLLSLAALVKPVAIKGKKRPPPSHDIRGFFGGTRTTSAAKSKKGCL